METTISRKREPADPDIDREFRIKRLMHDAGTSGRRIALANELTPVMVNATIRGLNKSTRVRRIIADAIGKEYKELWGEE
jgi:lambda repressor-like predicted transcriptional regulator